MGGTRSDLVGTIARAVVVGCFVAGGVFALVTRQLVFAGVAFLAGHTILAAAAVIQGQRRRGVGLSLSGIGWLALSIGLGVGSGTAAGAETALPETPLVAVGFGLVAVGMLLLLGPFGGD
ncbi:hypothetical protein [Halobellus inordinatus]|uniref:hypothetical protein n=1 Tax=Halobellus inordinatus TaxID=1126236 RepID=UPI0021148E6F|nr:hypothetical protein [Halobellus ramosii]